MLFYSNISRIVLFAFCLVALFSYSPKVFAANTVKVNGSSSVNVTCGTNVTVSYHCDALPEQGKAFMWGDYVNTVLYSSGSPLNYSASVKVNDPNKKYWFNGSCGPYYVDNDLGTIQSATATCTSGTQGTKPPSSPVDIASLKINNSTDPVDVAKSQTFSVAYNCKTGNASLDSYTAGERQENWTLNGNLPSLSGTENKSHGSSGTYRYSLLCLNLNGSPIIQGRATVIVNVNSTPTPPTLDVDLTVAQNDSGYKDSWTDYAPLNDMDLKAAVSGTATGNIRYRIWCDQTKGVTHDHSGQTSTTHTDKNLCDYDTPGTYTAKVIVDRGGKTASDTATITVDPPTVGLRLSTTSNNWQGSLTLPVPVDKIIDLRATVTGGSDKIDYYFWCDENDNTLDFNNYDVKKTDTSDNPRIEINACGNTYSTPGTYYPKVVMERDGQKAQDHKPVYVTGTLSATLTAAPSSGTAPLLTDLTATVSGTTTGTINYSFWWNCSYTDATPTYGEAFTACGDPDGTAGNTNGTKWDNIGTNPKTVSHTYNAAGTYRAIVVVERGSTQPALAQVSITVTPNQAPTVSNLQMAQDRCTSGLHSFLTWDYDDPELDAENAYQVIVKEGGVTFWDSGKVEPSYGAQSLQLLPYLAYGSTYTATVQAWDINDNASNIASSLPFTTLEHDKPRPNFTWPTPAKVGKPVQFTDTSIYDGGAPYSYAWNFACSGKCTPGTSSDQNPISTFFQSGNYSVNLAVADNDTGLPICSITKPVNIGGSYIPIWREIAPF